MSDGVTLKDDRGDFWGLSYSDFQAINYTRSGQLPERDTFMRQNGFEARRTFGHLGWAGLEIGPKQSDFFDVLAGTVRGGFERGIRTSMTFGDFGSDYAKSFFGSDFEKVAQFELKCAQVLKDAGLMEALYGWEVVNESDVGINWQWGVSEIRNLAGRLRTILQCPVWTSRAFENDQSMTAFGAGQDLVAVHLDPTTSTWEQEYRHARQGRGAEETHPDGVPWYNQEPRGPETSMVDLQNVGCLVALHIASILTSAVGTCYHSRHGTGNRGYRNLWDAAGVREVGQLSSILPKDIGRWTFRNHTDGRRPFAIEIANNGTGRQAIGDEMGTLDGSKRGAIRFFSKVDEGGTGGKFEFVSHALKVPRAVSIKPNRPLRVTQHWCDGQWIDRTDSTFEISACENYLVFGVVE